MDELLNDPFVNGVDADEYFESCQIVAWIRESCNTSNIFTSSTIKSAVRMILANAPDIHDSDTKLTFDRVNTSNTGLTTRDELIQLFLNVGYSFNVFEKWCDDFLVTYGQRIVSKDVDCKECNCLQTSETCEKHEIEGISFDGFERFLYGHWLSKSEAYRDRIFDIFDQKWRW